MHLEFSANTTDQEVFVVKIFLLLPNNNEKAHFCHGWIIRSSDLSHTTMCKRWRRLCCITCWCSSRS